MFLKSANRFFYLNAMITSADLLFNYFIDKEHFNLYINWPINNIFIRIL